MIGFIDRHGRKIGNVRISLTDRCNLRCKYCMPEDGIEWLNREDILSFEEITRLVKILYNRGIRHIRLTGGEPLLRQEVPKLISMIKKDCPDISIAMTTNGIKLEKYAKELKDAGLDRINISLDTLDHQKFEELTRRDKFNQVIEGIETAIELDFDVKINAVSIKGMNDDTDSLINFIDFAEKYKLEIRFIELMPFSGNNWENGGFISSKALRDKINQISNLTKLPLVDNASTSTIWKLNDKNVNFGFISSVSESFCKGCNRIRITAEGKLRPCLHNKKEYDLFPLLREKKSELEIVELIQKGLNEKWKEHPDFHSLTYSPPIDDREMIRIGG